MVFSSHLFLFYFLPLTLVLYYLSPRPIRHLVLTVLSFAFYGWTNPLFVLLMLFSTVIDYCCGLIIADQGFSGSMHTLPVGGARNARQKWALGFSICSNLSLLAFFKYFNFGIDSWNTMVSVFGFETATWDTLLRVTLPLGISFYTFQSMSYSIDIYRGDARPIRSFIDFSCYVSLFPQLVAGPIIRFREVDDQLRHRDHTKEKFARGIAFLALGLFKKVWLANPSGKIADTVFGSGGMSSGGLDALDAWWGTVAYAFQIYFDFSAYSDMAIGLGLMIGFVFPKNFNSPYCSQSITEFWQRWHISLSTWLREYLYIPLGGNRKGESRTCVNLMIVMLLGGLWHGSSWNFVIWGAIHGCWLVFERFMGKDSFYARLPKPLRITITFFTVCLSWVFFRADTLGEATTVIAAMFGFGTPSAGSGLIDGLIYQPYYVLSMVGCAVIVWGAPQSWDWTRVLTPMRVALVAAILFLAVALMIPQAFSPFIYFIF